MAPRRDCAGIRDPSLTDPEVGGIDSFLVEFSLLVMFSFWPKGNDGFDRWFELGKDAKLEADDASFSLVKGVDNPEGGIFEIEEN